MGQDLDRVRGSRLASPHRGRPRALLSATLVVAILSLLGTAVLAAAAPAAAQVTRPDFPTAEVTPEDALAYIAFALDQDSNQWLLASQLLATAGLDTTLEDVRDETLTDAVGGSTDTLPVDAFLGGEVAIVVTAAALDAAIAASEGLTGGAIDEDDLLGTPATDPGFPEATGAAIILDAQAPDTAFAGIETALDDQAAETGTQVVEVDYQGVAIQYVVGSDDGTGNDLALARLDDLILLAGSPTDLEPIIDTEQGTLPPLSEFAPFDDVRAALDQDYLVYAFANGAAAGDAQEGAASALGSTASALGGTDRYSGLLIRADDPGFRMETVAIAAEGEPLPPAASNYDSGLLVQTPGDALYFQSGFDLGQTGFLDGLGVALLSILVGQGGAEVATPTADQSQEDFVAAQFEQAAGLLGFNLQTELLQQFIGEYGVFIRSGSDPATLEALFVSEVGDPATVGTAVDQLSLLIQGGTGGLATITTRQVEGSEITVIDTGDPETPDVEFGVVNTQFLLGVGTAIDTFVSAPVDVLNDNPQFQEVMATLPAEKNGMLYVDLAQVFPLLQGLAESASTEVDDEFAIEDASPDCANYETPEEAQAAYDAGDEGTFDLDQDFDGEVCEDFFAVATPDTVEVELATPESAADAAVQADYSAIRAIALAAFDEDGMRRSSSILYIQPTSESPEASTDEDATPTP